MIVKVNPFLQVNMLSNSGSFNLIMKVNTNVLNGISRKATEHWGSSQDLVLLQIRVFPLFSQCSFG